MPFPEFAKHRVRIRDLVLVGGFFLALTLKTYEQVGVQRANFLGM
jgi:hypothetical protein